MRRVKQITTMMMTTCGRRSQKGDSSKDAKLPPSFSALQRAGSHCSARSNVSRNSASRSDSSVSARTVSQTSERSDGHVFGCCSSRAVHFTTIVLILVMAMWLVSVYSCRTSFVYSPFDYLFPFFACSACTILY